MTGQQHIEVRVASSTADMEAALAVRHEVFVLGQGVPLELEHDEDDAGAVHVVACDGATVVGTARLTRDGEARIGRVAVLSSWRRRGIAGMLLAALESEAAQLGIAEVGLHSQMYVQALYERHGYTVTGPGFVEAGIDHVPMAKRLDQPAP
ncbi:MAG: GNAT family N-acetyltransferase [Chloroflexi bacterium]|nr:GNAT family N-acetyltransferase [Chloroflexota bacterium]